MDEIDLGIKSLVFFFLIVLSAFFSGSEVAIFGLTREEKEEIRNRRDGAARSLQKLLDFPQKTLVTILTGNNLVNIAAASLAALLAADFAILYGLSKFWLMVTEVAVVTSILLLLGEITPKIISLRNPLVVALRVSRPLSLAGTLLFPAVAVFTAVTNLTAKILGVENLKLIYSTEELKTLVEVSEERGQLEESEKEMITSIFTFGDTLVKEIMVPRPDMSVVSVDTPLKELIKQIRNAGYTRYPVFRESIDRILGFLYAKDLLKYLRDGGDFNLEEIVREPYFVPENKEIAELLREFQKNKIHIAVVVDEYGGTAGLVTLEDILEEIVGEIQDEYDQETPLFNRLSPAEIEADARLPIDETNEILGEDVIPDQGGYETLGGFIYDLTGRIPAEGEFIEYRDYKFIVAGVDGQRITKVRIEKKSSV